jgi:hypothetical protein
LDEFLLMAIIGWKAWFVSVPQGQDILRFSSTDTTYDDLPDDGCLGFVVYYDRAKPDGNPRRLILKSEDYYFMVGDTPCGNCDSLKENKDRYTTGRIIRGMWTSDGNMEQADDQMCEAVTWP